MSEPNLRRKRSVADNRTALEMQRMSDGPTASIPAHSKSSLAAPPCSALYTHREKAEDLGEYYTRHVAAMTAEGLHFKSHIAAELAWRDSQIDDLKRRLQICHADARYISVEWLKENGHAELAKVVENIRKHSAPNDKLTDRR